jgi:GntR family transcriptional regulator
VFALEFNNNYPIYLQVVDDIKRKIIKNELNPGDKLPSNSELAIIYKINPNTVQRIYKQLEYENICFTRRGLGTYVSEDPDITKKIKNEFISNLINDFIFQMDSVGFSLTEIIKTLNDIKEKRNVKF